MAAVTAAVLSLSLAACSFISESEPYETVAASTGIGEDKMRITLNTDSSGTNADITLNIAETEPEEDGEVNIVFAGDINFDERYAIMASMIQRGEGVNGGFSDDVLEVMRSADICMVNNEFPYSNRGEPTENKEYTFRARPEYASYLSDMGVDIVALANNHASDYGEISLLDTLDTLDSIGISHVGAGRNLEEASSPYYFTVKGKTFAFIAATQIEKNADPSTKGATETSAGVFRCVNDEKLLEVIAGAKKTADFVIVYIHWGTESTAEPDWMQLDAAPRIAEAGADLIIGDHPHVLQPVTYCGDVPVVYSLGNFLFNSRSLDTCLVRVTFTDEGLTGFQFIPARQSNCRVFLAEESEKDRILQYMRDISPTVTIDDEGYISKK